MAGKKATVAEMIEARRSTKGLFHLYLVNGRLATKSEDKAIRQREWDLAEALERYTSPDDPEYDPEFTRKIKARQPQWFGPDGRLLP